MRLCIANLGHLPKKSLLEEISADVATVEIANFTARPDLLQTPHTSTGDVCILLGQHDDYQTGVHRDYKETKGSREDSLY